MFYPLYSYILCSYEINGATCIAIMPKLILNYSNYEFYNTIMNSYHIHAHVNLYDLNA